jgi:hypothetical protein
MSHYLPVTVLQPGRYEMIRGGQTASKNVGKHLQIGTINGHTRTGQNSPSPTVDQLVLVRILLRQLPAP